MAVTATVLGPNSKALVFANTTGAEILQAISDTLTAAGWTVWDQVSTTNVVFRSKCYDNVNYKYAQVLYSASNAMYLNVFENWNTTSHSGTNQVYLDGSGTLYQLSISLTSMTINVFCSARYLYLQLNNAFTTRNDGAGLFEFTRDNPADTPALGVPNFFMTTGMHLRADVLDSNTQYFSTVGGVPRNRAGLVGKPAAMGNALISPNGIVGSIGGSNYSGTAHTIYSGSLGAMVSTPNFVTTASNLSNLVATKASPGVDATAASFDWRGRVFGLKTLPTGLGVYGDILPVTCDANGFSDPSGTPVSHIVIGACTALPY